MTGLLRTNCVSGCGTDFFDIRDARSAKLLNNQRHFLSLDFYVVSRNDRANT
jgi:hypothetical protein